MAKNLCSMRADREDDVPPMRQTRLGQIMPMLIFVLLAFLGFLAFRSQSSEPVPSEVLDQMAAQIKPGPEARAWLKSNGNPSALAGNRFDTTAKALAFVDSLYSLGAVSVHVTNIYDEPDRIQREGGPYADTLVVTLPRDWAARQRLFAAENAEAEHEGMDPQQDRGQNELTFWWD